LFSSSENSSVIGKSEEEEQEVIVSRIPKARSRRKQAKLDEQLDNLTAIPPKFCYYCDKQFINKTRIDYQKHILLTHPGRLAYPGLIEIKLENLKTQGYPTEA
jgi:hypothetical protein